MSLQSGTRLGTYEVLSLLGAGGMGEVYRARDLELRREVAIKVLPASVGADPERLERLRREAQVLAALNHPNIAQIYGLTGDGAVRGLVLELVEGETLAERLARAGGKGLALGEALGIARQIADALETAHEKGVVHRDLKPANVKITSAGTVKVLDFGIATIVAPDPTNGPVGASALTQVASDVGAVAGTIAYMSPEQARGAPLDRRADVWAFGCVLYELLSGRAAFDGPTSTDTLAAVLSRAPDWTRLPADTPPGIRRLLERCLQKEPAQRFRDLGDARFLIEDAAAAAERPAGKAAAAWRGRPMRAAGAALLALVIGVGALAAYLKLARPASEPVVRMSIGAPGAVSPQLSATLSPDGRSVAFVSTDSSGQSLLWVRALGSLEARALPGTERAAHPFWSPDGLSIGFVADAKVKRVAVAGGPVQVLADTSTRNGPAWAPDGTILFTPDRATLATVSASGGPVRALPESDPPQVVRAWPRFLPDGRHFIYWGASGAASERGIYWGSLDSPETKFLLRSDFRAWYAPPGYLVFPRDETLVAQPFDPVRLELHGEPEPVAEGVWFARGAAQSSFSVTERALAYVNASLGDAQLLWFDRAGRPLGPVSAAVHYEGRTPQISPDGRRIAIGRGEFGREDIWLLATDGGSPVRLTFTPEGDGDPAWSADGRRVMYASGAAPGIRLFAKDVDTGTEELLLESKISPLFLLDWSRDGRYAVLASNHLWIARLDGQDRSPVVFEDTPYNEAQAQVSPNGQWIAYTSNETGRDEVYVQSFPMPGRKKQVSSGGVMPRWRADGRELFYLAADQFLMAVPIADEGSLTLGVHERLFRTRLIVQGSESVYLPTSYAVAPDGSRFLVRYPPEDPGPPITVVLNWQSALKH